MPNNDKLTHYSEQAPFETKDGSEIRELMHPAMHGNSKQSLAEARIRPGGKTALHIHHTSEELYYVNSGRGRMTLGAQRFEIRPRDTIAIEPGTPHCVENDDEETLVILCCCCPPYSHDDTELI